MSTQPSPLSRDEIETRIIEIMSKVLNTSSDRISIDSSFEDLGVDSLDAMEILYDVEESMGIMVPDGVARALVTVRQVVEGSEALLRAENLDQASASATDDAR